MKIVAATSNKGKIVELANLLEGSRFEVIGLDSFAPIAEPEEDGITFAENAAIKAGFYARHTLCWALADDSGLIVDALGGAPGVFSARYGGAAATDADRIKKLLTEIDRTNDDIRSARFACAIAVADPDGRVRFAAEGFCEGRIAREPAGVGGFGYDPVFVPDGHSRTFGELDLEVKQRISHRSRAMAKIIPYLLDFTAHSLDQ